MTPTEVFLQQALTALTIGSYLVLIALGYIMVCDIIEIINFARGITRDPQAKLLRDPASVGFLLLKEPAWGMALALLVYGLFAFYNGPLLAVSRFPYFNYLADAFLHGQLNLRILPPAVGDLIFYQEQYYLYWPPFPAVLLMPFVAVFGVGFSDILFTLVVASLNVFLVALLLKRASQKGIIQLTDLQRAALTLFFAFGTVHITLAPFGRVWFTGQIVGFSCVALAYLAAISWRGWPAFVLSGLAIACAALTRNGLAFTGIWPAYYLIREHRRYGWRLLGYAALGTAPLLFAVGSLMLYNWLRFRNTFDFGLDYHLMHSVFMEGYQKYGAFNLSYLPINFYYQYLAYPFPLTRETFMGGSLFLLSPVFFAAFWGFVMGWRRPSVWWLVATILAINVPILLLMGTGWVQFGPRYTLDFTLPLLLLTSFGVTKWPNWLLLLLTLISVAHYLVGTCILMTLW